MSTLNGGPLDGMETEQALELMLDSLIVSGAMIAQIAQRGNTEGAQRTATDLAEAIHQIPPETKDAILVTAIARFVRIGPNSSLSTEPERIISLAERMSPFRR